MNDLPGFDEPPVAPGQTAAALPDAKAFRQGVRELQRLKRALAVPLPPVRLDPAPGVLSIEFAEASKNLGAGAEIAKLFEEAARIRSLRKAQAAGRSLVELYAMGLRPRRGRGRPKGPRLCVADADAMERLEKDNRGQDGAALWRVALQKEADEKERKGEKRPSERTIERRIKNAQDLREGRREKKCASEK
jgi:hypothetical protein